jgi:ADP-ribosylglycohydrolase
MITHSKIAGAIYGLALGDTLGNDTEFMTLKTIRRKYGSTGYMPLPQPVLHTDDTQMTIAVGRALEQARYYAPNELIRTIGSEFIRWAAEDPVRAPGASCMMAIRNLKKARRDKKSWVSATTMSKGCGANMRVAPAALLFKMEDALNISHLQAAMTHGHPLSLAATELTALAIRWAAEGVKLADLPRVMLSRSYVEENNGTYRRGWLGNLDRNRWGIQGEYMMQTAWRKMSETTENVISVLDRRNVRDVCRVLGGSWVADEAYATALYHAVRYADDPLYAISMAARTSGDSDSIACITGAIVGAAYGEECWPYPWRRQLERRYDLEATIDTVWDQYRRQ